MTGNQAEWWHEFFTGEVLDFVRHSRDETDTAAEADFVQEALGLPLGSRILDVPCGGGTAGPGTGRKGLPGHRGGHQRAPAGERPGAGRGSGACRLTGARAICGSYLGRRSLTARCASGAASATSTRRATPTFWGPWPRPLKPGAPFLLDTPLLETRLPEMEAQERVWWPVGDLLALEERSFDHVSSRVRSEWTFVRGGEVERKSLSLRLYTYRGVDHPVRRGRFRRPPGLRFPGLGTLRAGCALAVPGHHQAGGVTSVTGFRPAPSPPL